MNWTNEWKRDVFKIHTADNSGWTEEPYKTTWTRRPGSLARLLEQARAIRASIRVGKKPLEFEFVPRIKKKLGEWEVNVNP